MGDDRGRGVPKALLIHDRDTVCGEDLKAARESGFRKSMGIHPHEEGTVDFFWNFYNRKSPGSRLRYVPR